jgi:uncharacterized membrane protein
MTITDLSPWVPVIAVFMPVLAALLVKYQPDGSGNAVRSVIASVLAAAVALGDLAINDGTFDADTLIPAVGVAVAAQIVSYLVAWQHLDINDRVLPDKGL